MTEIIKTATGLNALPVGSVIHNNAVHYGTFLKIDDEFDSKHSWVFCNPRTYKKWKTPAPIEDRRRSVDIPLPMYVLREGFGKEKPVHDELNVAGAVSAHYTVKRLRDGDEMGDIDTFKDAQLFARVLVDITQDEWHVIEHKFTETTVGVYTVGSI